MIEKTQCPKCGEINEKDHVYCWVCYQSLDPNATPSKTLTRGTPLPVSSPTRQRTQEPDSWIVSFLKASGIIIASIILIPAAFLLLLSVTCAGIGILSTFHH